MTADEFRRFCAIWFLRIGIIVGLVFLAPGLPWWAWIPIGLVVAVFTDWVV